MKKVFIVSISCSASFFSAKIPAIKAFRHAFKVGLKEAKDSVEAIYEAVGNRMQEEGYDTQTVDLIMSAETIASMACGTIPPFADKYLIEVEGYGNGENLFRVTSIATKCIRPLVDLSSDFPGGIGMVIPADNSR